MFQSPKVRASKVRDSQHYWRKITARKGIDPLLTLFSSLIVALTPAVAMAEARIGVVRGQQNVKQWVTIADRVRESGANYCVVDLPSWQSETDLGNIDVLFIPNVDILDGNQVKALASWADKGGKIILAGPTGNQATPEVRSQLRGITGSYWAFPMTAPATIEPLNLENSQLSSTLTGGVIVATNTNSRTIAVWLADGKQPAVVVTPKATYFGWRWGLDSVSSLDFDRAWLQTTLKSYGVSVGRGTKNDEVKLCSGRKQNESDRPLFPTEEEPNDSNKPSKTPTQTTQPTQPVVPKQVDSRELKSLREELDRSIARFEATLITAEAINSNIDLSTGKLVEEVLSSRSSEKELKESKEKSIEAKYTNKNAYSALIDAKKGRDNFLQLWSGRQYSKAKQEWTRTRRLLQDNYPTENPLAVSEIRGIWLDRGSIVRAKSEADLAKIFDRFEAAGINTVFFETVNASYTIYPSSVAPEQNPLTKGWDPLKAAVKLAHERGMEIHAWVWAFAAANERHNIILNQQANYLGPVLTKNPNWANINNKGEIFDTGGKAFFDPANAEVQNYLHSLMREIAENYDVDGIQLDYIRYPFQDINGSYSFGYGKAARSQFLQATGVDPVKLSPRDSLWSKWLKFRIETIDNFVATASSKLKKIRPDIKLSVAVFPFERQERLLKLQQNWEEWARRGWVDFICPMTYAEDINEFEKITTPLFGKEYDRSKTIFVPGIRLLNLPEIAAIEQMQLLRSLPTNGYALFAAENLNIDLENLFGRTQGKTNRENKANSPLSRPFAAADDRYRILQKEWNFLLNNRQLTIDEPEMRSLGAASDRLSASLQKLATNPTSGNLASAQLNLSSFRRRFPTWMRRYQQTQPYQVQTWLHRLDSLDRLLSYGERSGL